LSGWASKTSVGTERNGRDSRTNDNLRNGAKKKGKRNAEDHKIHTDRGSMDVSKRNAGMIQVVGHLRKTESKKKGCCFYSSDFLDNFSFIPHSLQFVIFESVTPRTGDCDSGSSINLSPADVGQTRGGSARGTPDSRPRTDMESVV
jgi:hypothetical protein